MSSWHCEKCSEINEKSVSYCKKCKQKKHVNFTTTMTIIRACPICQTENYEAANYCYRCGYWLCSATPNVQMKPRQKSGAFIIRQPLIIPIFIFAHVTILAIVLLLVIMKRVAWIEVISVIIITQLVFSSIYVLLTWLHSDFQKALAMFYIQMGIIIILLLAVALTVS